MAKSIFENGISENGRDQLTVIAPFEPNLSICQHTDQALILRIAVSVMPARGGSDFNEPALMDVKQSDFLNVSGLRCSTDAN